jgi:predicted DNA-binding WGR domain protein
MARFELYRYTHPDGSSKDWAVRRNDDGSLTTRWGPTGPVLPQASTRRGDQIRLENSKRRKGYVPIGEVEIDDQGRVQPVGQAARAARPPEPPEEALYWRLSLAPGMNPADLLVWSRLTATAVDRLAAAAGLARTPQAHFEPGTVQGWSLPATDAAGAGQVRRDQGPIPLLVLLAMKALAPAGATLSLATEDGLEVGPDLRVEARLLAWFGTDLDTVRPMAEALGLLQPRLNLAEAIQSDTDAWF